MPPGFPFAIAIDCHAIADVPPGDPALLVLAGAPSLLRCLLCAAPIPSLDGAGVCIARDVGEERFFEGGDAAVMPVCAACCADPCWRARAVAHLTDDPAAPDHIQ